MFIIFNRQFFANILFRIEHSIFAKNINFCKLKLDPDFKRLERMKCCYDIGRLRLPNFCLFTFFAKKSFAQKIAAALK